jgi:hypothetical protein
MRRILYFIGSIAVLIAFIISNTVTSITPERIASYWYPLRKILSFLNTYNLEAKLLTSIVLGVNTFWATFRIPSHYINKQKTKLIKDLCANLLAKKTHMHRLTLYKEVTFLRAFWHFLCTVDVTSFWLHLPHVPRPGSRYLIIEMREGTFQKSARIFKVEENSKEKCQGVVGRIRLEKAVGMVISDLPDISKIDLDRVDINGRSGDAKKVQEYMRKGHLHEEDFNLLKTMNQRARHFMGSVIFKDNSPWGVLLVDSFDGEANPFTDSVNDKFRIYSELLSNIVSL